MLYAFAHGEGGTGPPTRGSKQGCGLAMTVGAILAVPRTLISSVEKPVIILYFHNISGVHNRRVKNLARWEITATKHI
jgi:hypothetical protein